MTQIWDAAPRVAAQRRAAVVDALGVGQFDSARGAAPNDREMLEGRHPSTG
ncbi:hypothetical protein ACFFRF_02845 [Microbacterium laevaniformans]